MPEEEVPRRPPEETGNDRQAALSVETVVVQDRGQWAVDIIVIFPDGVVRRRIDTYRTRRLAEINAGLIRRGAERDIGDGPIGGTS